MRPRQSTLTILALTMLALVPTVASTSPQSEDLRITGQVISDRTQAPLEAAQVYIPEAGVGALTDANGRYALVVPRTRVSSTEFRVVVQLIGFGWQQQVFAVGSAWATDGPSLTVDFRLQEQSLRLQELVVAGDAAARGASEARARVDFAPKATDRAEAFGPLPPLPTGIARAIGAAPQPPHNRRDPRPTDREQYAFIAENGFQAVADHPLSTFSIDVDRASYSNIRRFLLGEHRLPPVDAVQIEEMVNYFSYAYDLPRGDDPVAVTTELGRAPWNRDHHLLRVGLASRPIVSSELPPSNLVFLLDVSGSMSSPDKLPLVQASMRLLVNQMRAQDRVSIAVYAGAAGLVLDATPGTRKEQILEAIDRLQAGGSTAGGEGLRLAYHVAHNSYLRGGNNRVILATDGDFNVGESSDAAMVRLITEKREEGTFLTVLGFGTGNLQSEKMQSLAQHGNGNYAYIDGLQEARKVLVAEMGGTLVTVAKDVKVQIEFNPAFVAGYRLIGYENRLLAAEDFNNDKKDAGEMGAGHTVTALYEIVPVDSESDVLGYGVDPLRYQTGERLSRTALGDEVGFVKVRYKEPLGTESRLLEHQVNRSLSRTSSDFDFAAAVAGFGMLLRDSEYRGTLSTTDILALASAGVEDDEDGYRRGFVELVRAYDTLAGPRVAHRRR